MRIGVPKEIKPHEYRVGLTPAGVRELVGRGHTVRVESQAGARIGFDDGAYTAAGAQVVAGPAEVLGGSELIVKVKEPQPVEIDRLRPEHVLFTYLHLAADVEQAKGLMHAGATCIAYETVTDAAGSLPLLAPMSEIAGRMSVQVGAQALLNPYGGRGVLLGGIPGVPPARVVVLGGGVAGAQAAHVAVGLGASVCIIDRSVPRLRALGAEFGTRVETAASSPDVVADQVLAADLVIGTVLIPGAAAPKLVTRELVERMRDGSALVDVSIDQGGCFETSRPTTHQEPTYVESGIVHYCVTNMPGAVATTSTLALTNATFPFVCALADKGWEAALAEDEHLRNGLNLYAGRVHHPTVAGAIGAPFHPFRFEGGRSS